MMRMQRSLSPLIGIALYAGVMVFVIANWFDPASDERQSWSRHWWPLVLALIVVLHLVAGYLIGRLWALLLLSLPIAGAAWAEADCYSPYGFCGLFITLVVGAALIVGAPLLAFGVFMRRGRGSFNPPPTRYWP